MKFESLFPPDEDDSASLEIKLGETALSLSHCNTVIYSYRRHPEVNHVYHVWFDETDQQTAIFSCEALIEILREHNFKEVIESRPTEWDEKAFVEFQRKTLESDLDNLLGE